MAINKVGSKGIEDNSVAAVDFAPGTVTNVKLADGTVTNAKLSNSSLTASGTSVALGASINLNNFFIDWQSKITSDGSTVTTMVAGKGYFVDNSSAAGIVKLPAAASIGDFVVIKDYAGNFGTNNLTIQRNSHNIQGVANDSVISTNRASLVLVYVDSTKGWLYTDEHNVTDFSPTFISATGGTVTTSGDFKIHTFTGDSNFVVSQIGTKGGPSTVSYLVIAGGGGGAPTSGGSSGGGGAGGFREGTVPTDPYAPAKSPLAAPDGLTVAAQTYPITVGGGGSAFANGSNSVFSTITSTGGGAGGRSFPSISPGPGGNGSPGGSGGGGQGYTSEVLPNSGAGNTPPVSPSQGNPGGSGRFSATSGNAQAAGGGGGAGAAGTPADQPSPTASNGGAGGAGATSSINGTPTARAGGGGGGKRLSPGTAGSGGSGGGGAGAKASPAGTAGTANTGGGGGGGGGEPSNGAAGGKGIVIIRYKFQ